jgi:5-methylthioadenosine/S-adenosylhomocysteine deaminase
MASQITVIRNASYVVEFDRAKDAHFYRKGGDVAFDENGIVYVGANYDGEFATEIDGSRHMVMPGLISIHGHSSSAAKTKGCWEELGSPRIYMSTLFEYQGLMGGSPSDNHTLARYAAAEFLRSGCTTVVDIHAEYEGWAETLLATGMRAYLAPMFSSARYANSNGYSMEYNWDVAAGEKGLASAINLIEAVGRDTSGRLGAIMSPGQVDTCTPELLRMSAQEADRLGVPRTIHASQSVHEFREIVNRHGLSSMEFLDSVGFLSPTTIIGHGIFIDDHPWIHQYPEKRDRKLLAERGCTVAHCPSVISRRGIALHTVQSYMDAGINMGIGMDAFPHNMIDEMRWGLVAAKFAGGSQHATHISTMFYMATRGGAKALGRDDLGIIEKGAQADLVMVNLDHPDMQPLYDPLYSLIFSALERPISDVFIAGRRVVDNSTVMTVDFEAEAAKLTAIQQRGLESVPAKHWSGHGVDKVFPLSLGLAD